MNRQALSRVRKYRMHMTVIASSVAFGAIFLSIALAGFHQPTPHGLRVGLVAPARTVQTVRSALGEHMPGAFDLHVMRSEPRARFAIEHRRIDGAVIILRSGVRLLTAEAGGTAPAQALTNAFSSLARGLRRPLSTIDVVAPGAGDSQGLSAYFLVLCVLFPSLAVGFVAGHVLRLASFASRASVIVGSAAVSGLVAAGIATGISGLGHYWAIAAIVALFSVAVASPTAALAQIRPHLAGLSVLAFLTFGIPASGGPANLAAFEPGFLRWLHPGLPLGIATDTIRNTVYFHSSDTASHVLVLIAFAAAGLAALCAIAAAVRRRHLHAAAPAGRIPAPNPGAGEAALPHAPALAS